MDKKEFLKQLEKGLSCLPQADRDDRLTFYSEMIDDYMEEGISEAEAVGRIGSTQEIIAQIIDDTPLSRLAKQRILPKRRLTTIEIVLLILGSPIWGSLLISTVAVILSLYISLWSVIVTLWSVFGALVASAFAGIWGGIVLMCTGYALSGIVLIGLGLVCVGISIFAFFGCKAATKGTAWLTKKVVLFIKNCRRRS